MCMRLNPIVSKFCNTIKNIAAKKKLKNITLFQNAMGADTEWVEMGIPQLNNVKKFAYARVKSTHSYLDYVESEKVRNVRGDELFLSSKRLDFIKCDVEGLELSVFETFLESIRKFKPVILCELEESKKRQVLLNLFSGLGYALYYLENKKLKALSPESSIDPVSHNYYFIPQNRLRNLGELITLV